MQGVSFSFAALLLLLSFGGATTRIYIYIYINTYIYIYIYMSTYTQNMSYVSILIIDTHRCVLPNTDIRACTHTAAVKCVVWMTSFVLAKMVKSEDVGRFASWQVRAIPNPAFLSLFFASLICANQYSSW